MCNSYKLTKAVDEIAELFSRLGLPLAFPEGAPNLEPREMIRITDPAPILRMGEDGAELVQRRWSWPGPTGKPVYNFRAEGRRFGSGRCLVPVEGFYEYTGPEPGQKRKTRWLFTMPGAPIFGVAGVMRGEAFSLLTVEPGPDVAPFHNRQVVVFGPEAGRNWLEGAAEAELLVPAPAGSLSVARA